MICAIIESRNAPPIRKMKDKIMEQKKKKKRIRSVAEKQKYILMAITSFLVVIAIGITTAFLAQSNFSFLAFLKGSSTTLPATGVEQNIEHQFVDKSNFLIIGVSDTEEYQRYFALIQVNMEMNTLSVTSLPVTTSFAGKSITALYKEGGGGAVKNSLATALGIQIDRYLTIKDSSFKKINNKLGVPTYTFAQDIKFSTSGDDAYAVRVKKGEQKLTGEQMLKIFRYSGEEAKDFKLQNELFAVAIQTLLNQDNFDKSESLFKSLMNYVDTDVVAGDYTEKKEVLEVLCNPVYSLTSQFIATDGVWGTDGAFTMSSDMLQRIKTQYYKEN